MIDTSKKNSKEIDSTISNYLSNGEIPKDVFSKELTQFIKFVNDTKQEV